MKEKHYRSLLKGITWRIIGTIDTIFLSWLFTRNIITAFKIGGIEVFTKIILFYLHERVWLKLNFARKKIDLGNGKFIIKDHHHRSIIKGFSWRFFGTIDTTVIAFFVTGDYIKAFSIGFTEIITKVFLYWIHERIWFRIKLGSDSVQSENKIQNTVSLK
jgi:uncharacterized membrane protein